MAKYVFNKTRMFRPVALVVLGWLAFVLGQIVTPIGPKLMLLLAARVLPQTLHAKRKWLAEGRGSLDGEQAGFCQAVSLNVRWTLAN